ncbi:MAG: hypothetical protein L3V56_14215 [Candidatus Magnetoovum sp. WYHC-5]|nr:hypothetical protein [Candidatus Magnetoovum sp. WYHC-5]
MDIKVEEEMPPEEMISNKLIDAVRQSENDIKAGRYVTLTTEKERKMLFQYLNNNKNKDV